MSKKNIKYIFKQVRDANLKYRLVEDGDKVAAGVSGGKDSFAMLYFLDLLRKYTPLRFELLPVYVDLGWENDVNDLENFCRSLGLSLIRENTNIGTVVFKVRQETNPCSLCSNLRRGALNRVAKSHGCNKVALGHHMDDVVNTLFMSILFEGRFHVFKPRTYLDRMDVTVIRPLIYVKESQIITFLDSLPFVPANNNCPADGMTKRAEMARLLDEIEQKYPGARQKFLASMENAAPDCFWSQT